MKKLLITLLLIAFVSTSFAQRTKATLFMLDGTKKVGLASFKTPFSKIKFKEKKGAKRIKYDYKTVKSIEIREDDKDVMYIYKYRSKGKEPALMEIIEVGHVSLYKLKKTYQTSHMNSGQSRIGQPTVFNNSTHSAYNSVDYYVDKKNESKTTYLGHKSLTFFGKKFKKRAAKYFSDCPSLIEKIDNKEFRKRDIVDVIRFYNEECK